MMMKRIVPILLFALFFSSMAEGAKRYADPLFRWTTDTGAPAVGWKIYTYDQSSSTPKSTYADKDKTVANTNPIILDARGEATIFWDGVYKIVIKDSGDVTQYTHNTFGDDTTVATPDRMNLIANGSFETDTNSDGVPDSWSVTLQGSGTLATNSADQSHGDWSVKAVSTGTGGGEIWSESYFPVGPQSDIDISFDLKSSVVDLRNIVEVRWYTTGKTAVSTSTIYDSATANPTSWTRQTKTETPPSTARYAKLRLVGADSSDTTPGTTWFDNVRVSAITPPPASPDVSAGYMRLGKISYSTTTAITLEPSVIHHAGTTDKIVYWDSTITFNFGSGGSNSSSSNFGVKQWHYLDLDDTAIVALGANLITSAQLINTTVAPTYNAAKHGYYNGNNRCIAAFRTNGSSVLESFFDLGNGWIQQHGWQNSAGFDPFLYNGSASPSYALLSPDIPVSTTAIQVLAYNSVAWGFYLSTDGTNDDLYLTNNIAGNSYTFITAVNASRQIYYKINVGSISLYTSAYHTNF